MVILILETKGQNIMKQTKMLDTTEVDVQNIPEEKQFKFRCEFCDMASAIWLTQLTIEWQFTKGDGVNHSQLDLL